MAQSESPSPLRGRGTGEAGGWGWPHAQCSSDHLYRLAQHVPLRGDAEAGFVGGGHEAGLPLRGAVGDRDGDVGVEVGGGEAEALGRGTGEVRDGGGDDVATPGVL